MSKTRGQPRFIAQNSRSGFVIPELNQLFIFPIASKASQYRKKGELRTRQRWRSAPSNHRVDMKASLCQQIFRSADFNREASRRSCTTPPILRRYLYGLRRDFGVTRMTNFVIRVTPPPPPLRFNPPGLRFMPPRLVGARGRFLR